MPGIAGIITQKPDTSHKATVAHMIGTMEHEDFYCSGTLSDLELGIEAAWTVIEGSFASNQLFKNETGEIIILLSGECFIDSHKIKSLEKDGHIITENPGDWMAHFYEEEGENFFKNLNGLFSGILIDKRRKSLFLFNDRYGVERLYIAEKNSIIYFASEAKALLKVLPESRSFDEIGLVQHLAYGCTINWRSLYNGIDILPGGSLWKIKSGATIKTKYFTPDEWENENTLSEDDFHQAYRETLDRVLPKYLISNTPLGISLTAGLDTRMVMACLPPLAKTPTCYTFSPEQGRTLDSQIAEKVAHTCGFPHKDIRVDKSFFSDFNKHADQTVYYTDGTFGSIGAHEIFMSRIARRISPTRLTGNYGGEIQRGVSTFKKRFIDKSIFSKDVQNEITRIYDDLNVESAHPTTFAAFREIPWNLYGCFAAGRSQLNFRTPYLDNELVKLAYKAPLSLRKSRAAAVHHIRSKSSNLSNIPTDKSYLGNSIFPFTQIRRFSSAVTFKFDYYNNEGLPHYLSGLDPLLRKLTNSNILLGRHKHLHYRSWFRYELADYMRAKVSSKAVRNSGLWDMQRLQAIVEEHISGRRNCIGELDIITTFASIESQLLNV